MTIAKISFPESNEYDRFMGKTFREVLIEGREEGREEGLEQGKLLALRRNIKRLAETRGLHFTAHHQDQRDACSDLPRLEAWLLHTATMDVSNAVLDLP